MVEQGWLGNMRNKAIAVVAAIGLLTTSVAFILGIITGANNAGGALIQAQPNENCFLDPNAGLALGAIHAIGHI